VHVGILDWFFTAAESQAHNLPEICDPKEQAFGVFVIMSYPDSPLWRISMSKKALRFQLVRQWIGEHWFLLASIVVVLLLLIIWLAKPISFAIFRLYAQDCGSVSSLGTRRPENGAQAKQREACFWQAFQQCHAALLTYTDMGVDTSDTHAFTVANNFGSCMLSDNVEFHGLVRNSSTTYTCSGLMQKPDGLHFLACSDEGEIVVPDP
jgi:hypothetical protein